MALVPSATWQMLEQRIMSKPLPQGLDAVWDRGTGLLKRAVPRQTLFLSRARKIVGLEKQFSDMSSVKLAGAAVELREIFHRRRETDTDVERAFALVREVAFREIGERPFMVQVAGALALEAACIAEMATGEGKTLTSTMATTVAGWRGRGCHVVTVNDYLARRDAEWMGPIYRFCGLKVAYIEQETPPKARRAAYLADITYCTNKEVAADFLRDRLALGRLRGLSAALLERIADGRRQVADRLVQRGLEYAIVDEADSILIDEAITPLIISGEGPNPEQAQAFSQAAHIAGQMRAGADYTVDERYNEVELTPSGRRRMDELCEGLGGIWGGARRSEEMVTQALVARELYLHGKQYVIDDGKVVIVDEFTGRLMPDREWRDGLHQAVEAKEALEINPPKDTYARISFQRFFRMYRKLAGMTGTASEAVQEFWQIYHLPVAVIPTNRKCRRKNLPDIVLASEAAKWGQIVSEIRKIHKTGRPILVGTRSVRASEHLSSLLLAEGLDHQVLNAVYHKQEAEIVARAGQRGKITVATNMAGRGTDIKLGRGLAELGGLHVIASERHEAGRVDRQLFGRCARQGDPGSAQAIVSLEDELLTRYAKYAAEPLRKRYGSSARDISSPVTRMAFKRAQRRSEALALRRRKEVLTTDHWLDEQLGFAGAE
jgi:preprotein translocase subunit SecA